MLANMSPASRPQHWRACIRLCALGVVDVVKCWAGRRCTARVPLHKTRCGVGPLRFGQLESYRTAAARNDGTQKEAHTEAAVCGCGVCLRFGALATTRGMRDARGMRAAGGRVQLVEWLAGGRWQPVVPVVHAPSTFHGSYVQEAWMVTVTG